MSKRQNQRKRAISRAEELYGLELSYEDYENLCRQIFYGTGIFIERQSLRVSKWMVSLGNEWYPVVYDKKRKSIATFLPNNYRYDNERLLTYIEHRIVSKSKDTAGRILTNPNMTKHIRALVSIGDPLTSHPYGYDDLQKPKMRGEFHDTNISGPTSIAPTYQDMKRIIQFGEKSLENFNDNQFILVHCQAGISRSSSMAYTLRCMMMGEGKEQEAARLLFKENPGAWPNTSMIKYADKILQRDGRMVRAIEGASYKYDYFYQYDMGMGVGWDTY